MTKSEIIFYNNEKFELNWILSSEMTSELDLLPTKQCSGYYFNKEGKLLLVKKIKTKHWSLPGGHPEIGETPLETAKRELLEESDQVCDHIEELGSVLVKDEDNEQYLQKRFFGVIKKEKEFEGEFETEEIKFIPVEDIGNYVRYSNSLTFHAGLVDAVALFKNYENSNISTQD